MLEIKHTEVFGLERAIKASGNPMSVGEIATDNVEGILTLNNEQDYNRAKKLGQAEKGSGHDNFLSGILVQCDVKYPQYWSPEFQRYHFAQIVSSQSKMHKLITMASSKDFDTMFNKYVDDSTIDLVQMYIQRYNEISTTIVDDNLPLTVFNIDGKKDQCFDSKKDALYFLFMKALGNLPLGFEMWMTISTNYLQLKTIYFQRHNHKLREDWGVFCDWCESLPMFKKLVGIKE